MVKGHSRVIEGEHNTSASCCSTVLLHLPAPALEQLLSCFCRS